MSEPPDRDATWEKALASTLDAFRRLVQAAADAGRDWKLVDALLHTTIELATQNHGDVFISVASPTPERSEPAGVTAPATEATDVAAPPLRLRAEYRLRLEAVIDSWSDDETADFLLISKRQVRRRAQQGALYYFLINRKRRYPVWQFDRFCGVLSGTADVARSMPDSWPPERVYAFMTTQRPELQLRTPSQWLLANQDPNRIVAAIENLTNPRV